MYRAKSRGFRQISHSQINHSQFDLAPIPPPPPVLLFLSAVPECSIFLWRATNIILAAHML